MGEVRAIRIGDRVRVRGTPATLSLELAGRAGVVKAESSSAPSDDELIGQLAGGSAFSVHFENLDRTVWISSHLLELLPDDTP